MFLLPMAARGAMVFARPALSTLSRSVVETVGQVAGQGIADQLSPILGGVARTNITGSRLMTSIVISDWSGNVRSLKDLVAEEAV